MSFANILPHLVDSVFVLLRVSSTMWKFLVQCSPICLLFFPLPKETYTKNITKTDVKECNAYVFF